MQLNPRHKVQRRNSPAQGFTSGRPQLIHQMKIFIYMLLTSLLLTSCANSGPQPIGKDSYIETVRVPLSGQSGAKTEALVTANKHCAQIGKRLLLDTISSSECALHGGCGEAQITYFCLDEADPRFKAPQMRKDADTLIRVETK